MKKLALTIAVVLGLSLTTFANTNDGGLFQRGASETSGIYGSREGDGGVFLGPGLPIHDSDENHDAPIGSSVAVLLGLGAAYLIGKKRNEK